MAGLWDYIKTLFGQKVEEMKDPEVEIEQAIRDARERDRQLRSQAAKVIAHRTRLGTEQEDAGEELATAKELAKQALMKADEARQAGREEDAQKWEQSAQAIALRIQAAQGNYDRLQTQLVTAEQQAVQAKQAVQENAMQLQEISSRRMELLGQLETARMQESVNDAMGALSARVDEEGPDLRKIEDKIQQRMAEAQATAELDSATPEGSMRELERSVNRAQADQVLDDLRTELGLTSGARGALPASERPGLEKGGDSPQ